MKWVGSTKVQHLCWSDFALSLTKEADRTDLKSKLLVLITKVIDHHIDYGHLVYFGSVDFQHRLCIALSWLLRKRRRKPKLLYLWAFNMLSIFIFYIWSVEFWNFCPDMHQILQTLNRIFSDDFILKMWHGMLDFSWRMNHIFFTY